MDKGYKMNDLKKAQPITFYSINVAMFFMGSFLFVFMFSLNLPRSLKEATISQVCLMVLSFVFGTVHLIVHL